MLALYLASLGFGSVLIGVSLFFGGADKDFDKDLDVDKDFDLDNDFDVDKDFDLDKDLDKDFDFGGGPDVDAEAELDAEAQPVDFGGAVQEELDAVDHGSSLSDILWLPIFSVRFWTFGSAAFGFSGATLTLLSAPWLLTLLVAMVFGTGSGTAATWFFRALKRDAVSGTTTLDRFAGEEARVVLPIAPDSRGKIVLETASGTVELIATTRDAKPIERGTKVLVARVRDGVADVSALRGTDDEARRRRAAANKASA